MRDYMNINQFTAMEYIGDYLTNSGQDSSNWDVFGAADSLVDFTIANDIKSYDDVPVDVFVDIVSSYAL